MLKLIIPPPVYAILFAMLMWALNRFLPLWQIIPESYQKAAFILIIVALLMDFWSLALFFRSHTTPNPMKPNKTHQLVVSGIYRFSRNPMYLSLLLLLSAWAISLGSLSPFLCLPLFVLVLTVQQILPEERILAKKFGQEYLSYKKQVRRWL